MQASTCVHHVGCVLQALHDQQAFGSCQPQQLPPHNPNENLFFCAPTVTVNVLKSCLCLQASRHEYSHTEPYILIQFIHIRATGFMPGLFHSSSEAEIFYRFFFSQLSCSCVLQNVCCKMYAFSLDLLITNKG